MPYSNFGNDTIIVTEAFPILPQSLQANAGILFRTGHDRDFPNLFQFVIQQSPYQSTLYSLDNDSRKIGHKTNSGLIKGEEFLSQINDY